jgi:uncharacterized secreted protein with C-terminal beta-propeller domain
VLKNLGGGLAPWNVSQYDLSQITPVFYHFHYFRYSKICGLYEYIFGPYELPKEAIVLFYEQYLKVISRVHKHLLREGFSDEEIGYATIDEQCCRKPFHMIKSMCRKNKRIKRY